MVTSWNTGVAAMRFRHNLIKCAWCSSELVKLEQEALKKESQHLCLSCCQSDDEYYGTNRHLKKC